MLTHRCCGLWLTPSCKLWTRHQEHEKDNLSSRTIWKTDTVLKEGYVPFQSVCNTVCTREAATSPAQRPAVKLPLGLGETVECGWCESWFELEIAKAQGLQLWAAMSGWGCVCPSWWNSRLICGVRLCVFASANVSAYGHVCIFTCCLQASISHSWGCHLREKGWRSHSFPVWGLRASTFASPTGDVGNVRHNHITKGDLPQGFGRFCQSAECSFLSNKPVRWRWQLTFVLEISCPVLGKGLDKVHWGGVTPLTRLPHPPPPPPHSLLSSRHSNPHRPHFRSTNQLECLMCRHRSDPIGCFRGCLGGQSCVHFTLCPFGPPPAAPSACFHREQKKKSWKEGDKYMKKKEFVCTQPSVRYDFLPWKL